MKWFRHLTTASDDDAMIRLLDKYGAEAYGMYWIIVEKIGRNVKEPGDEPTMTMRLSSWSRLMKSRSDAVLNRIVTMSEYNLLEIEYEPSTKDLTIRLPKLLKYTDEWTRRLRSGSEVTPKQLKPNSGVTPYKEIKERKEKKKILGEESGVEGLDAPLPPPTTEQIQASRSAFREAIKPLIVGNAVADDTELKGKDNGGGETKKYDVNKLTPENERKWEGIINEGLTGTQADSSMEAYLEYQDGAIDVYGFAERLDKAGIRGQDRIKVYAVLGVGA